MPRTIFDTPVVNTLLRAASHAFLRLHGWTVQGALPDGARKGVLSARGCVGVQRRDAAQFAAD